MSHLNSGRLNLGTLRDVSRMELFTLLDAFEGTKSMIWDAKLISPFGLISDYGQLKEHQVIQMLELRGGKLPNLNANNVVYFIRPCLPFINIIAENIKLEQSTGRLQNINLHLIFVPHKCILCERKLQVLGVFGDFTTITEYSPDFYVHDFDVLSIEWPLCFRECQLESDYASLYQAARSLMSLQCLYGIIPSIIGLGRAAKTVYDIMIRMRREMAGMEPTIVPQIDQLILIDRSIDLLSPMVCQLTYEGLLDEIYQIKQTVIELPSEKFLTTDDTNGSGPSVSTSGGGGTIEPPTEKKRFYLNSGEELYKKLRDAHYLSVGPILHVSAKQLAAQFDERKLAKTVREIHQFVNKIPLLQKLRQSQANHTAMAELVREYTDCEEFHEYLFNENELLNCIEVDQINTYIETCISCGESLLKVLRLIAIQSFCGNGLKQKVLDFYKHEIVQTYGYEHMLTLYAMERAGLLRVAGGTYGGTSSSSRSYTMVRNRLKLVWDTKNVKPMVPSADGGSGGGLQSSSSTVLSNLGNVHHGYTPLSVRIVQQLEQFGFRSLADLLTRHLFKPDLPLFEEIQQLPTALRKRRNSGDTTSIQSAAEMQQKLVLVFYLGGCTFAEISSLRALAQKDGINSDFLIATTSVINGDTFLQSLVDTKLESVKNSNNSQ